MNRVYLWLVLIFSACNFAVGVGWEIRDHRWLGAAYLLLAVVAGSTAWQRLRSAS